MTIYFVATMYLSDDRILACEEKLLDVYMIICMLDKEINFCVNYKKQFDLLKEKLLKLEFKI